MSSSAPPPPRRDGPSPHANNVPPSNRTGNDTSVYRRHGLEEIEDDGLNKSETFRASQKLSHAPAAETMTESEQSPADTEDVKETGSRAYAPHSARPRTEPTLQPGAQAVSGPMIQESESSPSGRGDDGTYLATAELVSEEQEPRREPGPLVLASPMPEEENVGGRGMKKFYVFAVVVLLAIAGVGAAVAVSLLLRKDSSPANVAGAAATGPSLAPSKLPPTGMPSDKPLSPSFAPVALPPSPTQQDGTTTSAAPVGTIEPTMVPPISEPPTIVAPVSETPTTASEPPTMAPTPAPVTEPPTMAPATPAPVTEPPTQLPTSPPTLPPTTVNICTSRLPSPDIVIDTFSATDFFLNINNWSDYPDDLWDETCVRVVNYETSELIVEKCNLSNEDFSFEADPSVTSVQLVFEDARCPNTEPYSSNVVELVRTDPPTPSPTLGVPTPEPTSIESYARQIWADAEAGTYPWRTDEPCIEHPTFRFGTEEAYTAMAVAATNVFKDPRFTFEIHDEGMLVNSETNIPMSNCGSLEEFSIFLENYDDLIAENIRMELREARLAAGFD